MNIWLFSAGLASSLAALLHLGCIAFGAPWYRFFGAGEQMAQMAEGGSGVPTLITLGIFFILAIWAGYAFAAVGLIPKLPLMRVALSLITAIYLLRGIVGFLFINNPIGRAPEFWLWSSSICLAIGLLHLVGTYQNWTRI